jgi:hypothetical protein
MSDLMGKYVYICGHSISHRAARMLASMADHKGVMHTADPERDWNLLTKEHIHLLGERMGQAELRHFRGVGHLIARELERFFAEFGITLRSTTATRLKPKWLPKPRWKQQQPTDAGWYWWREDPQSEPTVCHVSDVGLLPHSGWWMGPLEAPRFDAIHDHSPTASSESKRNRWQSKADTFAISNSFHLSQPSLNPTSN